MKKYINSEIKVDKLSDFFNNRNYNKIYKKDIENKDFDIKTTQKKEVKNGIGYCIRTGKEIAFNIERPTNLKHSKCGINSKTLIFQKNIVISQESYLMEKQV